MPTLHDDVWSTGVFPFLDYQSILCCSEVCRQFHHVIPSIKDFTLVIRHPHNMNTILAKRFNSVERIDIRNFSRATSTRPTGNVKLCTETAIRFVNFIKRFPNIKEVYIGHLGYSRQNDTIFGPDDGGTREMDTYYDIFYGFVNSICWAYRGGDFPSHLRVLGLFDDKVFEDIHQQHFSIFSAGTNGYSKQMWTNLCASVLSSIPLDQACQLSCAKSRGEHYEGTEELYSLPQSAKEKVDIIMSRDGGRDAYFNLFRCIYSEEEIGDCWSMVFGLIDIDEVDEDVSPNRNGGCYCYVFELGNAADLEILLDRYDFPFLNQSQANDMIERIFKCAGPEEQLTKRRDKCFISSHTYDILCKLGPFSKDFFIVMDETVVSEDQYSGFPSDYYHNEAGEITDEDLAKLRKRFKR